MKKAKYLLLVMFMLFLTACNVELHVHSYSEEYQSSQNYHWKECECGHLSEKVEHHGGEATCTSLAVCEDCGVEYGDFNTHKYELVKYDEENHWNECACGKTNNVTSHYGGTSTCEEGAICEECSYVYEPSLGGHKYDTPAYDKENHWNECWCGEIDVKHPHEFNEGVTKLEPTDKEAGIKEFSCKNCDYKEEREIAKIAGTEYASYPQFSNCDIVYYDGSIYTYGGNADARTNAIYRYVVSDDKLYKLDVTLTMASTSHRVMLVGSKVYVFGGLGNSGARNLDILVHDLENQTMEIMEKQLPFGLNCFQIGLYENTVYLVGGTGANGSFSCVYSINLETLELVELDVNLPNEIFKGAWCGVGKYLYVIGGTTSKARVNTIYRFDMETHEIMTMNATLPENISQSRATYGDDGNIYIYGGTNSSGQLVDYIMVYNIENDTLELADYKLPMGLANVCVANTGNGIYVLGGSYNDYLDVIIRHDGEEVTYVRTPIYIK